MATKEQRRMIDDKMTVFVNTWFNGNYKAAFNDYDTDRNGVLDKEELKRLLMDAGIGTGLTRWLWANGIIAELDKDGDNAISWEEFLAVHDTGGAASGSSSGRW
ncbi:EF-hand domain-containing protein [Zavarzinella formosa]|uniref:EF-hand domain-containing protein n=1 Tax=Zavarzinella formosa TaxID=360055 RepID=UPI0002E6A108|nr:EF-hand domain-containing protein [Zavarzinella formosa]